MARDQLSTAQRREFKKLYAEIADGCREAAKSTERLEKRGRLRSVPVYMAILEPVLKQFWLEGGRWQACGETAHYGAPSDEWCPR